MRRNQTSTAATSGRNQSTLLQRLSPSFSHFTRDESGALIVFGLIMFVMMVIIGGIAVDIMRFETVRTKLQSVSDRSALAAASLTQPLNPTDVVNDYFAKENLTSYLKGVTVVNSINSRSVTTDVAAEVPSFFMQMIGVDSLTAPADSSAQQKVSDVEISLVLDVSGSMNSNSRLVNLRVAAKAFVDTVLAGDTNNKISISIVPFNGQVNMGATLAARYSLSTQHNLHTCIDFATADYSATGISPTTAQTRSDIIDPWDSGWQKPKPNGVSDQNYCTTDARTIVRPFLRDIPTLKAAIDGLVAEGNTSIDIGMKWGLAMLDPGTQPVVSSMIGSTVVPAYFSGRPYSYTRPDSAKVIVLMSDGENTPEYKIKTAYKSGASPVYRNPADGSLAIFHSTVATANKYYVIPKANFGGDAYNSALGAWQASAPAGYVNLSYPELFNYHPLWWVSLYLYGNALGTDSNTRNNWANTWWNNFFTSIGSATKDSQTTSICALAKNSAQAVRVFTIAFEAPAPGQAALHACASSDGDYFNVTGLNITTAFQAIAHQVTALRLTQ